jgi:histidine ammonia-lyase
MQEDHVSMGWGACLKLRHVLDNVGRVLAVELLCAARALDLRSPLKPAPATAAVRDLLRERVRGTGADRPVAPEIEIATELVAGGEVRRRAERVTGGLE